MYCRKCGKELSDDIRYCPACGTEQYKNATFGNSSTATAAPEVVEKKPARVWSVFSKIGRILGIVSISTAIIPYLIGFELGVFGIVFSCLGRKAKTDIAERNFKLGLTLSIVGVCVSLLSFVIYIVLIVTGAILIAGYY